MTSIDAFISCAGSEWPEWQAALGAQWPEFQRRFHHAVDALRQTTEDKLPNAVERTVTELYDLLDDDERTAQWLKKLHLHGRGDLVMRLGGDGANEPAEVDEPDQVSNRYPDLKDRLLELDETIAGDRPHGSSSSSPNEARPPSKNQRE